MTSQRGEFGRDNRNKPDDQAERLRNSRISNERLAEMIELLGDKLDHLHQIGHKTMAKLDALEAEVGEVRGTVDSAVALIQGLRQQIIDAGTDPAKLAELVAALDKSQNDLAAAVAENPGGSTGRIV